MVCFDLCAGSPAVGGVFTMHCMILSTATIWTATTRVWTPIRDASRPAWTPHDGPGARRHAPIPLRVRVFLSFVGLFLFAMQRYVGKYARSCIDTFACVHACSAAICGLFNCVCAGMACRRQVVCLDNRWGILHHAARCPWGQCPSPTSSSRSRMRSPIWIRYCLNA